jgi:hypothetical protein
VAGISNQLMTFFMLTRYFYGNVGLNGDHFELINAFSVCPGPG